MSGIVVIVPPGNVREKRLLGERTLRRDTDQDGDLNSQLPQQKRRIYPYCYFSLTHPGAARPSPRCESGVRGRRSKGNRGLRAPPPGAGLRADRGPDPESRTHRSVCQTRAHAHTCTPTRVQTCMHTRGDIAHKQIHVRKSLGTESSLTRACMHGYTRTVTDTLAR